MWELYNNEKTDDDTLLIEAISYDHFKQCYIFTKISYVDQDLEGGPSAPWATAPLSGLATDGAPAAIVAEASRCPSGLSAAALTPLVASNQPARQGVLSQVCCRPCDNTLQLLTRRFHAGAPVAFLDGADQVLSDVAIGRLVEVDWVPLLPDAHPSRAD